MAGVKQKYIALTGIDFKDGRIEAGDPVPEDFTASQIEDLLAIEAIKPKESEKKK